MDAPPQSYFGTPEFLELGQSVIDMGATLHNRAATMRAYADHVTHELKSPLTAITGAVELLQGAQKDTDRAALALTIPQASARMEHLLADLRRHAAAGAARTAGYADLAEVASKVTGIEVVIVGGAILPMPPDDLAALLTKLAQNAVTHGARRLELRWDANILRGCDDGEGVAEGNQSRLFDPFFTTTREQGGTGMGLSIVQALATAHGGQVHFRPTKMGACFEVVFLANG